MATVALAVYQLPHSQRLVTAVMVVQPVQVPPALAVQVVTVELVVPPPAVLAPSVAMAGLLAQVAMVNWALAALAVTVALEAHRPTSFPRLAMAATAAMVNPAALALLAQPVPVARVVTAVPVVVPRAVQHNSEQLVVPVVPVVTVVSQRLLAQVPVA